ncbi:MAG: Ig-like domain-containing protein [Thermoplasmata archaeon]|nr:Ig-like domain-containing protein [Thermoplasmata archaeon]
MKKIAILMASIFILASLSGCVKKDREAPYLKVDFDGISNNGWYRSNVTVTIHAIDNKSGVKEIKYRMDGDIWRDYIMPVKIKESGEHLFECYAKDKKGNMAYINKTLKIDKIKPKISFQNFEAGHTYLWGRGKTTLRIPKDTMIIGSMDINVNASDSLSGMQKVEFYLGDEMQFSDNSPPYSWHLGKTIGVYNITAIAYDIAGNENAITIPDVQIFIMR